ncbi:MAG: DUF3298 domain-containing protein [Flavobacteriales bacterium]|nr:DUF3298 domain-containing protein [Flavobacteriales bacterium]
MRSFIALLSVVVILLSCQSTKPLVGGDNEQNKNIVSGEVTRNLMSSDKADTVESSIQYMFYEITELPYQDTVNRMIKEFISGVVSYGTGATDQNSLLSVDYMNESIDEFADEYNRQLEFVEGGGVWTTEASIQIKERGSDYVELYLSNWSYSGGAHGIGGAGEFIIDMKTGKELFLTDFISDVNELTRIAEEIFRADQELAADANLIEEGYWFPEGNFQLNENFEFNGETLDFLYNVYEIAPYAAGPITISIPMSQVKPLLKRKVH